MQKRFPLLALLVRSARFVALATPFVVASGAVRAQAHVDVPHDGRWSVSVTAADGSRQRAVLVIRDFAGHWTDGTGKRAVAGAACAGKRIPITVQESTAEELAFTVWGKTVSPRCLDLTFETRTTDAAKGFDGRVQPLDAAVTLQRLDRRAAR